MHAISKILMFFVSTKKIGVDLVVILSFLNFFWMKFQLKVNFHKINFIFLKNIEKTKNIPFLSSFTSLDFPSFLSSLFPNKDDCGCGRFIQFKLNKTKNPRDFHVLVCLVWFGLKKISCFFGSREIFCMHFFMQFLIAWKNA